jgi:hypothetical protein
MSFAEPSYLTARQQAAQTWLDAEGNPSLKLRLQTDPVFEFNWRQSNRTRRCAELYTTMFKLYSGQWKDAQGYKINEIERPWAVKKSRAQRVMDSGFVKPFQQDQRLKEAGVAPRNTTRTRNHPDFEQQRAATVKHNSEYAKRRKTEEHLVDLIVGMPAGERREVLGHAKKICDFGILGNCSSRDCIKHHLSDYEKKLFEDHLRKSKWATPAQQSWWQGQERGSPWSNWSWSGSSSSASSSSWNTSSRR